MKSKRSPIYLKMPDGRKMNFNTLDEMNDFIDKDEKAQLKQKKKEEKLAFKSSIFDKKREEKPIKT